MTKTRLMALQLAFGFIGRLFLKIHEPDFQPKSEADNEPK
jgi:hypothetical protein